MKPIRTELLFKHKNGAGMVIVVVISVDGAPPIIKVGIHWRIGVHTFRYL